MPIVHIYLTDSDDGRVRTIADNVHLAMVETIGIPDGDRFQVIHRLRPEDLIFDESFLDIERSSGFLLIEISLAAGRNADVKEELYSRICSRLESNAGCRPEDVFIGLHEVGVADFSLGMGVAQFVRSLPPHLQMLAGQKPPRDTSTLITSPEETEK